VGVANLDAFHNADITVGLGGDGFTQDMRTDMDLLPLLQRLEQRRSAALPAPTHLDVGIHGSARIVERLAGWRIGRVDTGYQASLIGLRYDPVLPLHDQNVLWHYSRGFPGATVRDVWSRGRSLLRGGAFQTVDVAKIRSEVSRRLDQMTS
jgi:cytosine/adenosine deaminase-related metal-dependent hydrolase